MKFTLSTSRILSKNPVQIKQISVYNPNTGAVFLKFYDSPGEVTLGQSYSTFTLQIPAQSTLLINRKDFWFPATSQGLVVAAVIGYADSSASAPAQPITIDIYTEADELLI
jgi:hypothetical protein